MKKLLGILTMAAVVLFGVTTHMRAAVSVQVGVTISCTISVSAASISVSNGLNANNVNGTGTAQFESIATTQTPIASTTFRPVSLNFTGSDPTYGSFSFSFDPTRPPANTTVVSNQPFVDFPATGNVFANVVGTVSGLPGVYTNNTVLHLRSTTLQTFNPQINEPYTVVSAVTFSNPNNPGGGTSFTIPAGATVILN